MKIWDTPSGYSPYTGSVLERIAELPHWVYEVYAADGACLYVGMTADLVRRSKEQRRRFGAAVEIQATEVPDRLAAERLEVQRTRELRPVMSRRRFGVPFGATPARYQARRSA